MERRRGKPTRQGSRSGGDMVALGYGDVVRGVGVGAEESLLRTVTS